jgi:outer membrane protein assembly factor BamD
MVVWNEDMTTGGRITALGTFLMAALAVSSCGTTYETQGLDIESLGALADQAFTGGDFAGSTRLYTELMFMYPGAAETDYYLYRLGLSEQGQRLWADAVFYLTRVTTEFPRSDWADDASYQTAVTWWLQKVDCRKDLTPILNASAQLDLFFLDYPGSSLTGEAETLVDSLEEQMAQRALFIGRFYARREEYPAALLYLREGIDDYGAPSCKADILIALSDVYEAMGNTYSARRSLERVLDECELDPERLAEVTEALERL